jgi:hypothetical protein
MDSFLKEHFGGTVVTSGFLEMKNEHIIVCLFVCVE